MDYDRAVALLKTPTTEEWEAVIARQVIADTEAAANAEAEAAAAGREARAKAEQEAAELDRIDQEKALTERLDAEAAARADDYVPPDFNS